MKINDLAIISAQLILLFIISIGCGIGFNDISRGGGEIGAIFSIFMALFCMFNILLISNSENYADSLIKLSPFFVFAVNFGLIIGLADLPFKDSPLWVPDSYDQHIPTSLLFTDLLKTGNLDFFSKLHVYLTSLFVGFGFFLFGTTPVVSAMVLTFVKAASIAISRNAWKSIFDGKVVAVGFIIYLLSPQIIFHTIVFFREATIHLLVALNFVCLINYVRNGFSWGRLVCVGLAILLVANERFYLGVFFSIAYIGYSFFNIRGFSRKIFFIPVIVFICGIIFYYLTESLGSIIRFSSPLESLSDYRDLHEGLVGGDSGGSIITGIIRLLFAPYVTAEKFSTYSGLSHLITWGSIYNLIFTVFFIFGCFYLTRYFNKRMFFVLSLAYFLNLLMWGYIAPFNFRIRDSFYLFFSMFSAFAVMKIFDGLKKIK